jgi:Ca2+-binding EF-hand superfamily protein
MKATNKKKLGLVAFLVAAATASLVGVAAANPDTAGPDREAHHAGLLQKYDTNHDGKLDATERQALMADRKAHRDERFKEVMAKYDTNRDGKLDDAERTAMRQAMAAERFQQLDTDKNGSLSLAEFQAGAKEMGHRGRGHGPGGFGANHGARQSRQR